ncbi:MAG: hypothetical protein LBR76_07995 [Oscillospiraceae bacterium]|nr:hypothetical protein [Oscillospiraceae bacterium]
MKLIRRIYGGHLILYPLFMTSFFLLLGLLLYEELKSPRAGFEVYPLFFEIGITPGLYIFSIQTGGFTASPYIFMDISEGMLFGGALFAYDTLRDIRPVKKENNYELFYEGKKVAAFVMLPDDMNYLREVLALRGKYAEHLE